MSIRNLIPKEQMDILKKKDIRELRDYLYVVSCDTCGEIFLKKSFDEIREEVDQGFWDKPQKWFAAAGRHWMNNLEKSKNHEINAYMIHGVHKQLIYALSHFWFKGMTKLLSVKGEKYAREAMLKDLENIEKNAPL